MCQVTEVTCPVIGRTQPELTSSKRQNMGPDLQMSCSDMTRMTGFQDGSSRNGRQGIYHIDGLVQERRNFSALAMELRLFLH